MGLHIHRRKYSYSNNFNPPIPCGMGPAQPLLLRDSTSYFNPPIPCGMGRSLILLTWIRALFQSTHPVWDGTKTLWCFDRDIGISIHPSRVGWDDSPTLSVVYDRRFQSTHPVWDGTQIAELTERYNEISIHPSRVGWDRAGGGAKTGACISIHPSRVGWDHRIASIREILYNISIHPSRVGWDQQRHQPSVRPPIISIHPPRVGWDARMMRTTSEIAYFNPPIPCGMGRQQQPTAAGGGDFNPPIPCGMGPSGSYL